MSETVTPDSSSTPPPARTAVAGRLDFSARLDSFQGPLDLLLYLIKENEVEITDIPIARILEQYLRFLDQAEQWDLQLAGEFLVMAATLMEIKSRELLPVQEQPAEGDEIIEDPRSELVRQLLEYRRIKDQARAIEGLQDAWQQCRPRGFFDDIPESPDEDSAEIARAKARDALVDVDLYALYAAYERVLKSILAQSPRSIVRDSETIEQKVARIETVLRARPFARFLDLVTDPSSRADVAATFVALLELVRRRAVRLIQQQEFGHFDVKTQTDAEVEAQRRQEAAAAEAAAEAAIKAKAEQDALFAAQAQAEGQNLPWLRKRRPPRPHFKGLAKPEDIGEIDVEEGEIASRIDAILAAADAISDRFEQSHEGRLREGDAAPGPDGQPLPAPAAPQAQQAPPPPPPTESCAQPAPQTPAPDAPQRPQAPPAETPKCDQQP